MLEKARVIEMKDKYVKLEIKRKSSCGDNCANCKGGCKPVNTYIIVENTIDAKLGELVELKMNTKTFMFAVIINYVFPLVMLLLGIFGGSVMANNLNLGVKSEIISILLGFTLMVISYVLIYSIDKKLDDQEKINFKIIRIL